MLDYAFGHDAVVAHWVAQLIPSVRERGFGKCSAIGVVEGERLVAGIVYHDYNPEAGVITLSGAALPGTHWCTPQSMAVIYRYPFHQLRCQMILQMVAADDERHLRQLAALNYAFVRVPRLLGRNADAVLCLLTAEAWADNMLCKRYHHHIPDQKIEKAA